MRLLVTPDFQPFFTASVAASAALIGLLFVSVSIAPERVFGAQSDVVRQAQALSAFSALANVFFISMMSLVPGVLFGLVVTVVSIPAILQTLALLGLARQWHSAGIVFRGLLLFAASAAIYGYELGLGIHLWRNPTDKGALIALLFVLTSAYAIGLGRAWELLGAPRFGLLSYLWALWSAFRRKPTAKS
ncbi:MAG TPA: hypothetical protein VNA65_02415 [Candidatus Dormibacteraeota bacterium]|nr:hypothetical protein [Candidatus Dormibacteraeota bacterium]